LIVEYRIRPGTPTPAIDVRSLTSDELAVAVQAGRITHEAAAWELAERSALGWPVRLPRTPSTSGSTDAR